MRHRLDWPLPYTLCIIRRGDELLLLNRLKSPNMGIWNGLGGKIEPGESPTEAVQREIMEEAHLEFSLSDFRYRGVVAWTLFDGAQGGMHVYTVDFPEGRRYDTPVACSEGILDFKPLSWVLHKDNRGVAELLPAFLPHALSDEPPLIHRFDFTAEVAQRFLHRHEPLSDPW
ncbi:NUDIX hydrolase [Alicyclobacillus acidoterrestris]|uniref:8-oxo-dGTP diphosphatase n=1 Tax=Alicyclobacillus acidoterrestris (strain ATCC 49025 / DSM 3922 / CIP 106132 / NCIMB 13137 / GD3B) TaxID=1356854 RepID=A0A9E6ZN48_ALIAG|nr:8-oxo-dGTP diphosphatase [Alicyclobacillus acidoterrestris]UNO48644.1 8-oxo-dGTP diphosphatase [Alicyclobacillus acidoterrestris]